MTNELKENRENRRRVDTVQEAPEQDDGWEDDSAGDHLGESADQEAQRREPFTSNELNANSADRRPEDTVPKEQDDGWESGWDGDQQGGIDDRANLASGDEADDHPSTSQDKAAIADHPDRPDEDSVRIPPDRAAHILDGDDEGTGGGHRAGTGSPGKTEFPSNWDDNKILSNVEDVARNPDVMPEEPQSNGRWKFEGTRDGVHTTVIVNQDGTVHTAWPREGDPGVVRNPEEG